MCIASKLRCYQQLHFIGADFSRFISTLGTQGNVLLTTLSSLATVDVVNFQCKQSWKCRQNDISFLVNLQSFVDISPLYNEVHQ